MLSGLLFAALACVCTATVVPCPVNTVPPVGAQKTALAARGYAIFTSQGQKRFNKNLPQYITEPNAYNTVIVPECYNSSIYRIQVTYKVLGQPQEQRIDGKEPNPSTCRKVATPTTYANQIWAPGATVAPLLPCGSQYRRAAAGSTTVKQLADILFTRGFMPAMKLSPPDTSDIYWCPGGVKRYTVTVAEACLKRSGATVWVSGKGKYGPGMPVAKVAATVEFVCAQQARIRRAAMVATMPYRRECAYSYTLSELWIQLGK